MRKIGIGFVRMGRMCAAVMVLLMSPPVLADEPVTEAQSAPGEAADRAMSSTGLAELALSRQRPDAAVWLELEDGGRALGLFSGEQRPPARGSLVVLADVGENAATGVVDGLARHLSQRGWAVLTVGLPFPSEAAQRALAAEPDPEASGGDAEAASSVMIDVMASADETGPDQVYRRRIAQTLDAAAVALQQRGYERPALLGVGRASNFLVAAASPAGSPRALIWVTPDFYPADSVALAEQLLSAGGPAVLELYTTRQGAGSNSQQRWAELRRAGVGGYDRQPVALNRPLSGQNAQALASRIDAWLRGR